jgi:L-lysine 2,3-aminomutase
MTAAVYDSCWGNTAHTFREVALSSCDRGCNVYQCEYCKRRQVLHNSMYGCHKADVPGEAA